MAQLNDFAYLRKKREHISIRDYAKMFENEPIVVRIKHPTRNKSKNVR